MPEETLTWSAIFEIWRDPANPTDGRLARNLAADIGAPLENVRVWHRVGRVPPSYWRTLVVVIAAKVRKHVTCEDLAAATERLCPPKIRREAA